MSTSSDEKPDGVDSDLTSLDRSATVYRSVQDLANALERAKAAHGEHEKRTGEADANWPEWYAAYMVAESAGDTLPT
jgi:hypothetical protein